MEQRSAQAVIGEVVLGRYLVDRLIGVGAFAWVFHGRTSGGESVAVKVLHNDAKGATLRFAREASVLKALPRSAHVVRLLDEGKTLKGLPLIVLEYVDGITLKEGLLRNPRPPARRAVAFVAALAGALAELHRLGVAHRDVKPANVLLTRTGGIKLIDFGVIRDAQGILKLLEDEEEGSLPFGTFSEELDAGVLVGSLPFMAPEQYADFLDPSEVRADTRSDVYSVGVILYLMLAGQSPFYREPPSLDCTRAELEGYVRWRLARTDDDLPVLPGIDAALESLVRRALATDPEQRPSDGRALQEELANYLQTGAGAPTVDAERTVEATLGPEGDLPVLTVSPFDDDGGEAGLDRAVTARQPKDDGEAVGRTALFFDPEEVETVVDGEGIHEEVTFVEAWDDEDELTTRWKP